MGDKYYWAALTLKIRNELQKVRPRGWPFWFSSIAVLPLYLGTVFFLALVGVLVFVWGVINCFAKSLIAIPIVTTVRFIASAGMFFVYFSEFAARLSENKNENDR